MNLFFFYDLIINLFLFIHKALQEYLHALDAESIKPVVWTGDLNVAHGDNDVAFPKKKRNKVPGFHDSERENFGLLVGGLGHVTDEQKKKRTLMVGRPGPTIDELIEPPFLDVFSMLHGNGEHAAAAVVVESSSSGDADAEEGGTTSEAKETNTDETESSSSSSSSSSSTSSTEVVASEPKRRATFWSYRFQAKVKDNGWRLDYFIISRRMRERVQQCEVFEDYYGLSDHCPLMLEFSR